MDAAANLFDKRNSRTGHVVPQRNVKRAVKKTWISPNFWAGTRLQRSATPPRPDYYLVSDEGRKHRADVVMDDQIGDIVKVGRFAIYDHESRACSFGSKRKSCGRPND